MLMMILCEEISLTVRNRRLFLFLLCCLTHFPASAIATAMSTPPSCDAAAAGLAVAAAAAAPSSGEDSSATVPSASTSGDTAPLSPTLSPSPPADDDDLDTALHAKALRSDVSARLAFQLLEQIAAGDALYRHLSSGDLRRLAAVLSVLTVAPDEQIIAEGEAASFVAIVLDGSLEAAVAPEVTVTLGRGAIVGEHSLFMGQTHRQTDKHRQTSGANDKARQ